MPLNKLFSIFLIVVLNNVQIATAADQKIKVGMLLPLSGNYASIGEDTRRGIAVALSESGPTSKLLPVYGDSRAEAVQAVTEFKKMVDVEKVIGAYAFRGPVGMAINPISKSKGIALLGGVGNKMFAEDNEYAFQMWSTSDDDGVFLAKEFADRGYSRIAMITAEDDWTDSVSKAFRKANKNHETKIVFDKNVVPEETDFRTLILQLKQKTPSVIFVNLGISQIGLFLNQLREQGVNLPVFSNFWINKDSVVSVAGKKGVEGVMFVDLNTDLPNLSKELNDKFKVESPNGAILSAYVATMLLEQAALELDDTPTQEEYYKALLKQAAVRTKNGVFPIEERRIKLPLIVRVMRNGKAEILTK